jgi:hypothetical protein
MARIPFQRATAAQLARVNARFNLTKKISPRAIDDETISVNEESVVIKNPVINAYDSPAVKLQFDDDFKLIGDILTNIKNDYIDYILNSIAEKTPVDTGRAKAGWTRRGDNIVNPVPYIEYIENGTLYNRPIRMVASTVSQSQQILDLVASRYIK